MLVAPRIRFFAAACVCLASSASGQAPPAPLTLAAATAQALAVNPAAWAATQQLAQAQARLAQADAGRRFQITFNSTTSGSNANVIQPPPSQESFYTLQNTLTVPLPLGNRPRLLVQQAQAQLEAARATYQGARLALAGQVGAAYYDLLRKQALLLIAQDSLTQAQRQLSDADKRNRAGDVPQLDVLRAQVPVASAQAQQFAAENDVAVARQTLNSLVGQDLDAPLAVAEIAPDAAALPLTLEQARARALAYSPDVRAAEANIRADQAALASARLFQEPTLSLQAIDIRSNDQTSFSRLDTVQAAVTVPLSDGGLGRAQVREAEAALSAAQAQAQTARKTVLVTVSAAYLTAQSTRSQVGAALVARDVAQTSYDKTRLGYENGLFPLSDVLNAQTALTQAQIAYTQALYNAAVAIGTLNAALNGGALGGLGGVVAPGATAPPAPNSGGAGPAAPGANNAGTSPAGANAPGTTPAGNSTTGNAPNGANPGGRGTP